MTHDLLQSDIDLAIRLKDDQRPDAEVIQVLVHRGIDSGKAAQLLDDLRSGRKVNAKAPVPSEFALPRRTRAERHLTEEPSPAPSPAPHHHSGHAARSRGRGRASLKRFRQVFLVLVGLAVVAVSAVLYLRYKAPIPVPAKPERTAANSPPTPPSKAGAAPASRNVSATASPALELGRMACTSAAAS